MYNIVSSTASPGYIKKPVGFQAKLAKSHGKPCGVAIELLDETNYPPIKMLSRAQALILLDQLSKAIERIPAPDTVVSIEVGAV
jgi:hypothetical protein